MAHLTKVDELSSDQDEREGETDLPGVEEQVFPRVCSKCKANESGLRVSLRPCHSCRDAFYCSLRCREGDSESHDCRKTISEASSFSRNCYILRSLQQDAEDIVQSITQLTDDRRDQLLGSALHKAKSLQARAKSTLKQVERWNPSLIQRFELKEAPFSMSPLRMLHSNWGTIAKDSLSQTASFVALSYCWRTPEWHPIDMAYQPPTAKEPFPISKRLWNFLADLLESDEEAVWIDQICLDQTNRLEKVSAVASMDALYASARLVFIALDDIRLSSHEVLALSYAFEQVASDKEWTFSIDTARDLFAIVSKIFSARWFSRAWCFHEYHLSKDRIMAIPCEGPLGSESAIGLVNLGEFVFRLVYFQDEKLRLENSKLVHRMFSFFGGQDYAFSNIIANTFSYNSKYFRDKLNITLNICELGISLKADAATPDESRLDLLIITLAAGDATILTTRGPKVKFGPNLEKTSWMQWPDETTWSTRHPFPLPRGIFSASPEQITLNLLFFAKDSFRPPSTKSQTRAKDFLASALADRIRVAYGLKEKNEPYVPDHGTISTLACALDCGLLWMSKAWNRIKSEVGPEVEQSFSAIENLAFISILKLLVSNSKRQIVRRTRKRCRQPWPQVTNRKSIICRRFLRNISLLIKSTPSGKSFTLKAYQMLLVIILFGKYWEMSTSVILKSSSPFPSMALSDVALTPIQYRVPAPSEHKLYSDAKYTFHDKKDTCLAIPETLKGKRFGLSDRLWLLGAATDRNEKCWRIKEKVCLLGCEKIRADGENIVLKRMERVVG